MNIKFYMTPGSCSTGIHILLEELEEIFEVYLINLLDGDQYSEEYIAINPKSTIPTLVKPDGEALTDYLAIAYWLACRHPKRKLLPESTDELAKLFDVMNYITGTIHGQGFARIFVTEEFCQDQNQSAMVKEKGTQIVQQGFKVIDQMLTGKEYLFDQFTIADSALFYVAFWANKIDIALPTNCQSHYERMLARPVVKRVLQEEGYRIA